MFKFSIQSTRHEVISGSTMYETFFFSIFSIQYFHLFIRSVSVVQTSINSGINSFLYFLGFNVSIHTPQNVLPVPAAFWSGVMPLSWWNSKGLNPNCLSQDIPSLVFAVVCLK